jgi:Rieske 2Fe-2S family protein
VHLLVRYPPKTALSRLAGSLKGASARRLRQDFQPEFFADYRDAGLGVVFNQDLANAREVTVGMHSPSFDGHRLSEEQEMTIYNHHRVADRFLWAD